MPADEPVNFTMMPDPALTDLSIGNLAFRVLGYCIRWMRLNNGRFPSTREIADDLGYKDLSSIRDALYENEDAGYLILGRRRRDSRHEAVLGYELVSPGPRLSAAGRSDGQGRLFPDDDDGGKNRARRRKKPRLTGEKNPLSLPPLNNPPKEAEKEKQPEVVVVDSISSDESPITEDELVSELAKRAQELTPTSEQDIRAALRVYSTDELEDAIEQLQAKHVPCWAYVTGTAANLRKAAAAEVHVPPRAPAMQNYNPAPTQGAVVEPVSPEERRRMLEEYGWTPPRQRKWLETQRTEKKPAAGPPTTDCPQPVGGTLPKLHLDYSTTAKSDQIKESKDTGQRARQDSNLQPSDSKSASLPPEQKAPATLPDVKSERKLADYESACSPCDRLPPSDIPTNHKPRGSL